MSFSSRFTPEYYPSAADHRNVIETISNGSHRAILHASRLAVFVIKSRHVARALAILWVLGVLFIFQKWHSVLLFR
jgi:hypothetical protein